MILHFPPDLPPEIPEDEWIPLGDPKDFSHKRGTLRLIRGRKIAIFQIDGEFFAINNRCPHAGASLCGGAIKGLTVTCRRHNWRFSLRTGECFETPTFEAKTYPIRMVEGKLEILSPPAPIEY